MEASHRHLTRAFVHLDRLTHNMHLLQDLVGERPLWPAIKANAYGHGADIIARHLVDMGYNTLCVAHVSEAKALLDAGIKATFIILSATLPKHAGALVACDCEPVVCTLEMAQALSNEAQKAGKTISVHVKVDTGMGRIGIEPEDAVAFLSRCRVLPGLKVKGVMSHFPRADEGDKSYSQAQLERFRNIMEASQDFRIGFWHIANSAAILDLPASHLDAARPGISIYGLAPSPEIVNPRARDLKPVLEWKTQISFLKEVPAGTGLSYGHTFHTARRSLIATVPVGYGDGLSWRLSNNCEMLVRGVRCPQVGNITMDQTLIDVTALRGNTQVSDEVVIIGQQDKEAISADELALRLGTIVYEVVTAIADRVPRVLVRPVS